MWAGGAFLGAETHVLTPACRAPSRAYHRGHERVRFGRVLASISAFSQDAVRSDFEAGFVKAKCRFDRVRETGDLTADDVMAIFSDDLPFVHDWTMPDRTNLKSRMKGVPELIRSLGECGYDLELIREIWKALRELSLTSLVLHHVYPDRFAMCSHHLASLLGVTASTVPEYYAKYCEELSEWTKRRWRTPYEKSVVNTEFALWDLVPSRIRSGRPGPLHTRRTSCMLFR